MQENRKPLQLVSATLFFITSLNYTFAHFNTVRKFVHAQKKGEFVLFTMRNAQ